MNLPFIFHSQTIDGLAFNDEQVTVRLKTGRWTSILYSCVLSILG